MEIKVCGLKLEDNIKAVAALKPAYLGFICYPESARFIGNLPIEVLKNLPNNIIKTGVLVNENEEEINKLISKYNFESIQLHGQETPDLCAVFRDRVTVLKAFGIDENFDFSQLIPYQNKVDYFLFDTKTSKHGGSGKTFDWRVLENYHLNIPFFLSGGLSLENLNEIGQIINPQFYGVDLNSKFEDSPGMKNIEQLEKAFKLIKNGTYNELRS